MASADRLHRDVARRGETDFQIDYFIHLLLSILTCLVWTVFVAYRAIRRRDLHFVRAADFAADAVDTVRERAESMGKRQLVDGHLSTLEVVARDLRNQATERGALLWVILSIVTGGLAYFVLAHFLQEDFRRHEQTEVEFANQLSETLRILGLPTGAGGFAPRILPHSFPLYLLLTLFSCGLFGFYWFYQLNSEENGHMTSHLAWESDVIGILAGPAAPPA
jgi:hypothetical protein